MAIANAGEIGINSSASTASSLVITAGIAVPKGNLIVVIVSTRASLSGASATDSRGNTYTNHVSKLDSSAPNESTAILSAIATTALQIGDTITVSFSSSGRSYVVAESFSGLVNNGRLQETATGIGSTRTVSATAASSSVVSKELRIVNYNNNSAASLMTSTSTGWTFFTKRSSGGVDPAVICALWKVVDIIDTPTHVGDWGVSGTQHWVSVMATFRAATVVGGRIGIVDVA